MGKISEWLEQALKFAEKRSNVVGFRVIVECAPNRVNSVASELRRMGLRVIGTVSNFISVDVKEPAQLDEIARIPGVVYISKEKIFWPAEVSLGELIKRIGIMMDPILSKLNQAQLEKLGFSFRPAAEIPSPIKALVDNANVLSKIVENPLNASKYVHWNFPFSLPVLTRANWRLVTFTRQLMNAPTDNRISYRTYVGDIDTGPRYGPGIGSPAEVKCISICTPPEPPIDTMGHGSWTQSCAFGRPAISRYGVFYPVANAPRSLHVKVFSAFFPSSGFLIMKAMEMCAKSGCKVVNMSLGGVLTEPVDKDPECKLLDQLTRKYGTIFCVAAGNDGKEWTIGSPGAALSALTVAALNWANLDTASYSSRGWQGHYYKKHKDEFEEQLSKYGDKFQKPDTAGIGGDINTQIVAAVSLWYDGMYDFLPDGWDLMIGTSMATPHVSGITALLVDRGVVKTVDDIKKTLRSNAKQKTIDKGWGMMSYTLFGGGS